MKKILTSLPVILLFSVFVGILLGLIANDSIMQITLSIRHILGQIIFFCVPLIIVGFIAPSICKLGQNANKMLVFALSLAYASSVLAALFAMFAGYIIIPHLTIATNPSELNELPNIIFKLNIPQIMPVMSALVLAIFLGLGIVWSKAENFAKLIEEFGNIVLDIVKKIIIPILPFFIACSFCALTNEGSLTKQLPVYVLVLFIVIIGHYIWLAFLYTCAGIYSKQNPLKVLKNYGAAYFTAIGTMSSAATLPVTLRCARACEPILKPNMIAFGIPLFANIHLCGSVLTEVFFVMSISQVFYGSIPPLDIMILFCFLLAIFAIGAPGVPGGTVMASLGLITSLLGFDELATALILTIFALQDSFGTACNVTADGALTMILSKHSKE